MKKIIGIYKITSPSSKIYIGQSRDIDRRFIDYKKFSCKGQRKLYASLKKYGPQNHVFEIVEECREEILDEREVHFIAFFNCLNSPIGLNLRDGGWSGKLSEESKRRIGDANRGEKGAWFGKRGEGTAFYGRKHTEESKKKTSKSLKGKMVGVLNPMYGMTGDKNPMYGRCGERSPNFGVSPSLEIRRKIGDAQLGEKNHCAISVVNQQSGIFYGSIKEAWQSYGRGSYSIFKLKLKGVKTNNTNYVYS